MIEIPVGHGMVALVDDVDGPLVLGRAWALFRRRLIDRTIYYATARIGGRTWRMHRYILAANDGQIIDHRNGNGLDNRRGNLRFCSAQENQFNKRVNANNIVGLKGVGPDGSGRWRARATLNYRTVTLGVFDTPTEASEAYQAFAKSRHGEFFCAG